MDRRKSIIKMLMILVPALAVSLAAYMMSPSVEQSIADPSSPLLKAILHESDFTSDWDWVGNLTTQFPDVPSQDNSQRIECATQSLQGYYGTERYPMSFSHTLHRYGQEVTWTDVVRVDFHEHMKAATNTPKLIVLGNQGNLKCIETPNFLECQVVGTYKNIVSIFRFSAPPDMEKQVIADILNDVLAKIDARVKDVEGVE